MNSTIIQGKSTMCLGSTALWLVRVYPVANECSVAAASFRFRRQLRKLNEEFEALGNRADVISMFESEFVVEGDWGRSEGAYIERSEPPIMTICRVE